MNKVFLFALLFAVVSVAALKQECAKELKKCQACEKNKFNQAGKCRRALKGGGKKQLNCEIYKLCVKKIKKFKKQKCSVAKENVDTYLECVSWSKAGECEKNHEFMYKKCKQSCCSDPSLPKCPAQDEKSLCPSNQDSRCEHWAKTSQCVKNPLHMLKNCMLSCCPTCHYDRFNCPTTKALCKNKYRTGPGHKKKRRKAGNKACKEFREKGECKSNPSFMNLNCSKECCPVCLH